MSAHHEYTSARLASIAGRILQDPQASARERSLAGSALTQARERRRKPWRPGRRRRA